MDKKLKVVGTTNTEANEITSKLEAQLQEITHKKQLADNRSVFLQKKSSLDEFKKLIESEIKSGNFESAKFKLTFSTGTYRDDEKLNISNTDLVLFFIDGLTLKIDEQVAKLEAELIG